MSAETQQSLAGPLAAYNQAQATIDQMVKLGIVISGPPIKKQTLVEKKKTIKNFDQLLEIYNRWAQQYPEIATPISDSGMAKDIARETGFWNSLITSGQTQPELLPNQQ